MSKKFIKIVLLTIMIVVGLAILTGCGNQDMWDTNYTFNRCITYIGNERIEIEIEQWNDYEGEQIQIKGKDGKIYLVSTNNSILIKD